MSRPIRYMQYPEGVPAAALRICECGVVVFNTTAHEAYHQQNDKDIYE